MSEFGSAVSAVVLHLGTCKWMTNGRLGFVVNLPFSWINKALR